MMLLCGVLLWFNPGPRAFYSLLTIFLALGSWVTSNLGGFFVGMLLGVVGGALAFAWAPDSERDEPSAARGNPAAQQAQPPRILELILRPTAVYPPPGGVPPTSIGAGGLGDGHQLGNGHQLGDGRPFSNGHSLANGHTVGNRHALAGGPALPRAQRPPAGDQSPATASNRDSKDGSADEPAVIADANYVGAPSAVTTSPPATTLQAESGPATDNQS